MLKVGTRKLIGLSRERKSRLGPIERHHQAKAIRSQRKKYGAGAARQIQRYNATGY